MGAILIDNFESALMECAIILLDNIFKMKEV